ncbi:hypothetical protein [Pantanalinema sp. GBBB05]|uniref:hypothetical protein n=1 Tax=Pantanalinema sp. GBBB05 TaxID=2604139 RepID=UPI001D710F35|nr:hypothetical protein [Pantanalinema sp. GBBB05]
MSQNYIWNLLVAATVASPLLFCSAARADQRDFTLVNDSSAEIHEIYVSTVQTNNWEEDVLGRDILPSGGKVDINFVAEASGTCLYDIRVITAEHEETTQGNVNLCQVSTVIFDGNTLLSQ